MLSDSRHAHFIKNVVLIGLFVLAGKFAGLGREMAVAYHFGVSKLVDQYVLVGTFMQLIPAIWVGVAVAAFVPLSRKLQRSDRRYFHQEMTAWVALVAILVYLLTRTTLPSLLLFIYPATGVAETLEFERLIQWMSVLAGVGVIIGLFSTQLLAEERHANTLFEGIPALIVMLCVLFWSPEPNLNSLVFGSVAGVFVHALCLWLLLVKSGLAVVPRFSFTSSAWSVFRVALGIMVLGKIVSSFATPIEQSIAALLGEGSITTLSYANKLLSLVAGIGATAVGRAILPMLSGDETKVSSAKSFARFWSNRLFVGGVLVVILGWFLAPYAVALLFERGQFTAEDTRVVTGVFRAGLFQFPFLFAGIILVQLFVSSGAYRIILASTLLGIFVKSVSSYLFSLSLGTAGIALGTSAMYVSAFLFLTYALRWLPDRDLDSRGKLPQ